VCKQKLTTYARKIILDYQRTTWKGVGVVDRFAMIL
jgi:hypothetical protein